MMTLREQGFSQNIQQPLQQGSQFGYPSQQSQQDMSQFGYAQPLPQQGFGQQQGSGPSGYPQQPLQGFSQSAPQLQQKMMPQFGYDQPPSQQGFGQQGFGQQGLGPLGYLQQPLQGFAQLAPRLQQEIMSQFGYAQPLPQQGFGQQGIGQSGYLQQPPQGFAQQGYAQQQPQQDFGGQAGQFTSGYDIYQQPSRVESDVPRDRRGPKNYARSDERIRELICERVIQNLFIDVSDVSIEVQNGRVALDGTVPNRQMKHAIEDVVDRCWGVQDIENNIHVQSGQESGSSAGGFGQEGRKIAQSGGGFANASSGASGSSRGGGSESKGKSREESHST
jgi:hypothetical protein